MTIVLGTGPHWTDEDSRKFLKDPLGLLDIDPLTLRGEQVSIYHHGADPDLLAQVRTKMLAYGATDVRFTDQRPDP